ATAATARGACLLLWWSFLRFTAAASRSVSYSSSGTIQPSRFPPGVPAVNLTISCPPGGEREALTETRPPGAAGVSAGRGMETILFVDDELVLRVLGQSVLQRQGYRVLLAANGAEAIEVYRR